MTFFLFTISGPTRLTLNCAPLPFQISGHDPGRDDLFYVASLWSAALGFKIFFNAALRAKSLPTPDLKHNRAKRFAAFIGV